MIAVLLTLLLCVTISTSKPGVEVVGPDGPVVGVAGEDLVLPCFLKPNTSAVDMEVVWMIGGDIVHHYKRHMDWTENQLPAYSGRTSLFREELQRGNISLKLRAVRLSDTNKYRCYIAAQTGTYETPVVLIVEAVGTTPVTSTERVGNGSVRLHCESSGWLPEPQVQWLDSKGRTLPAEPTMQRFPEGFRVNSTVTVEESDGSIFFCRVTSSRQTREMQVEVPRLLFAHDRHHWTVAVPILLFVLLLPCVCGLSALYHHRGGIHHYKEWVISNLTWAHASTHLPGEDIKIYTDPLIIRRPRGTDGSAVSRKDSEDITLDQLFSPDHSPPSVLVLQGHSGYGKSITARKIICDWASGKRYAKKFYLVVLLRCKELKVEAQGRRRSLLELISLGNLQKFGQTMEEILKNAAHKVLFIIDGFDELKLSAVEPSTDLPRQPFTTAPPTDIICALLRGFILPESSLLVTTRRTGSKKLIKLLKQEQHVTEILGFSEDRVKKYFVKFFEKKERADGFYRRVCNNEFLLSSCSIPMLCWMICSILKESSQGEEQNREGTPQGPQGEEQSLGGSPQGEEQYLVNSTSIFVLFVSGVLKNNSEDKDMDSKALAKLARDGTLEKKFLFEKERVSGLDKIPLLQRRYANQQVMYSFVHQNIQEFFSALYYITLEKEEMITEVKELLESVKAAENIHLLPVVRLLFGFSNENVWIALSEKFKFASINSSSSTDNAYCMSPIIDLQKTWFLKEAEKFILKDVIIYLHWLYELHEDAFVKVAMEKWNKLDFSPVALKRIDCWALRYCLQCKSAMAHLNLSNCNLTARKLKLLEPALSRLKCEELWLDVDDLRSDADVGLLVSALGAGRILRRLRVDSSQLSDRNVQDILSALEQQKLVGLVHLSVKTVSIDTAEMLLNHLHNAKATGIISMKVTGQEDGVYSSLFVEKNLHSFTVGVEHHGFGLSVTTPLSQTDMSDWTEFLTILEGSEQTVWVERLRSSAALSKVTEINLMGPLQPDLLSLINTCSSLQDIKASVKKSDFIFSSSFCRDRNNMLRASVKKSENYSLISSLCIRKDPNNMLRLTVELNTSDVPHLALISLSFPTSNLDHRKPMSHLGKTAKYQSEIVVDELLSTLKLKEFGLREVELKELGLMELELRVESLTQRWAQRIISLINSNSSLNRVQILAGVLKQEGITLLLGSPKRQDCTITATGTLDWPLQRKCFLNHPVKIIIVGDSYEEQSL